MIHRLNNSAIAQNQYTELITMSDSYYHNEKSTSHKTD